MNDQEKSGTITLPAKANLRLFIIENVIKIEELASYVLGKILNIEWQTSKSFGHSSSSLSFNQKLQLIQDIKGIDKENLKKLTCIAEIRNKFAHLSHINSFESLFADPSVGKKIKNNLLKWYSDENGESDIPESKRELTYQLCFFLLIHDIAETLLSISDKHSYDIGYAQGENEVKERILLELATELISQGQIEVIRNVLKKYESDDPDNKN